MRLMIVESPNKCAKIRSILGDGWLVAASMGHIRNLPERALGITRPDYALQYELTERGKEVINGNRQYRGLKIKARNAAEIYLATDPDREGEAIAWHLRECLNLKNYSRVTFDAITEDVVKKALKNARQLDMNLVRAQEANRVTDRLIGYRVSPMISNRMQVSGLSPGRVHSVAVRLVVERQREIEAFKPTKHYGTEAIFANGAWTAQWDAKPFLKKGEEYILSPELAARVAQCTTFHVEDAATKSATASPPAPFTTSTLLQAANVTLGFKPEQTARLAQSLFEQGLITYHRTDSQNFSPEALEEIRAFARANKWAIPEKPRTWKSKEGSQEAHEAIRPTYLINRKAGSDDTERRLYALIRQRAVASQLADAEYSVNTLRLVAKLGNATFVFKAAGQTLAAPGWTSLTAKDASEEDNGGTGGEDLFNGKVPTLSVGTAVNATSTRILNKQTKAPPAYTQASLIKRLEAEGIGCPSTYSRIMKTIIELGYVTENRGTLSASQLAYKLIDALVGTFAFVEYYYARSLEQQIDNVGQGTVQYVTVVSQFDCQLDKELCSLHIAPRPASRRIALSETPQKSQSKFSLDDMASAAEEDVNKIVDQIVV